MTITYTIRDTNSSDSGLNFAEAVERIASWYEDADQWADGQGDRELRTAIRTGIKSVEQPSKGNVDTLHAYADAVCNAVAKAMGNREFAGHGSYSVSAADQGGFRLVVEAEISDELRDEISDAVLAADVCCEETVFDACLAVAKFGGDWRAELAKAKANDASERKALQINE